MATVQASLFLLFLAFLVQTKGRILREGPEFKALREKSNQTEADTLNLPANASSIRENITDTFNCDNRTYGYYADVDNDCQVFHVCLPSQTPYGRNVTYRWSFICPNETVFNQEALTCTRPQDSIDCKDAPMYYHLNMEIGKFDNKTEEEEKKDGKRIEKRKLESQRANLVLNPFIQESQSNKNDHKFEGGAIEKHRQIPTLLESVIDSAELDVESVIDDDKQEEDVGRIVLEKKRRMARKLSRGSFRFKGDV